jgi:hypothetical protein
VQQQIQTLRIPAVENMAEALLAEATIEGVQRLLPPKRE